ncbi:MAG: DedA family protein [Bacteroidales bacterium]|nr:DedA family protein [Bacteroidales bacterium]
MQILSSDFIHNLTLYGYYILFILVFLQEVGVPSPLPNELVMIFSGYMVFQGKLHLFYAILSAFAGDILGSTILFIAFYFFGKQIMSRKPSWIPISESKLNKLSQRLQSFGSAGFFLGRLSPFIRGYVSVISGLMNVSPKRFLPIIGATASLWATFYILAGYLLGPYWGKVSGYLNEIPLYLGFIPLTIFVGYILFKLIQNRIAAAKA